MNNIKPLNSGVSTISNQFKVISAKVIDSNSVIRNAIPCRGCGKIGLQKDMEVYHNYGLVEVIKTYWCDECFALAEERCGERVSRKRSEVHSYKWRYRSVSK